MLEAQLHFISTIVILLAAIVPIYLTIKLKGDLKKLTAILSIFILIHAAYQVVGFFGLTLLADGVLEPLSAAVLIFFGINYSGIAKQRNLSIKNMSAVWSPAILLLLMNSITIMLLLGALGIFVWLAVRSRNLRNFQFQLSIFIIIWIVGDMVSFLHDNGIVGFSALQSDLGSGIHVVSMVFFSMMLWLRYYYSERSSKKMIEDIDVTLK
jgi:TctA family transporter